MELLDAAIALVITLAALATTVTVLMEIWARIMGLKSRTQVELFQTIFEKAVKAKFPGQLEKWAFVENVLKNPLVTSRLQKPEKPGMTSYMGLRSKGVYEWVSDEHVYRRLLAMQGVLDAGREELVTKLKQFSRKYDEYCAAASVEFKDNRRRWSIVTGMLLAIVFNIDGIRIFNEYVKRPELAATMAAKAGELERTAERVEARLQDFLEDRAEDKQSIQAIEDRVDELKGSIAELEAAGIPIGWGCLPHCSLIDKFKSRSGSDKPQEDAKSGGAPAPAAAGATAEQVAAATKPSACRLKGEREIGPSGWIGSVIAMLGTGILIGLGAPFWFDVASRLAEVRSFFGGKGGGEAPYDGESAGVEAKGKSKSDKTKELINRVVDEALAENHVTGVRRLLVERSDN